jgi:uncharacterized protein (UPF0335 family)
MVQVGGIAADQLKSFVERVERLAEEMDNLRADMREVLAEAKAMGFDSKIIRKVIRLRKMDQAKREEEEQLTELYEEALSSTGA